MGGGGNLRRPQRPADLLADRLQPITQESVFAAYGYEPTERLDALREVFFSDNQSFGKQKIVLKRQSEVMPKHAKYVENRRWTANGILFITINQPGSLAISCAFVIVFTPSPP